MIEFKTYITQYGKENGLPNLTLDSNGICSLNFDKKTNIDIVYNAGQNQCFFAASVGNIPDNNREDFFKQLLISNAFGIENDGAVLGIDEKTNRVILSYTFIPYLISYDLFKVILSNFISLVESWKEQCATLYSTCTPETTPNNPSLQAFGFARV